jgi:predicted AlkP superfamily pyrophosphatase or phosphodiesterase
MSATGPGHATLATGDYPATSGIVGNEWLDPVSRKPIYCVADPGAGPVGDEGGGLSPKNLAVTALGDWLKAARPESKVISVAGKDRSAILLGGQHPDGAFWYNPSTGHMVSSAWYGTHLPAWAAAFNAADWTSHHTPDAWTKLLEESAYAGDGPDDFHGETLIGPSRAFPHPFTQKLKTKEQQTSPFADMLLLDFASEAVRGEKLGGRGATDLLLIGLSATDYVGHSYGPDSHEMHDHLLRLDRALGEFLNTLEKEVGRKNLLVALSADHGVMPNPEFTVEIRHGAARRISVDKTIRPEAEALEGRLRAEMKVASSLFQLDEAAYGGTLDAEAAARAGVSRADLERRVRDGLGHVDGVEDVFFRDELESDRTPERPYLDLFRRSYDAPRSEDFVLRYCENCLVASWPATADHGSPYAYDTHVPILFWGDGVVAGRVSRSVHSVDIAPTLAAAAGLPTPKSLDGRALPEVLGEK